MKMYIKKHEPSPFLGSDQSNFFTAIRTPEMPNSTPWDQNHEDGGYFGLGTGAFFASFFFCPSESTSYRPSKFLPGLFSVGAERKGDRRFPSVFQTHVDSQSSFFPPDV